MKHLPIFLLLIASCAAPGKQSLALETDFHGSFDSTTLITVYDTPEYQLAALASDIDTASTGLVYEADITEGNSLVYSYHNRSLEAVDSDVIEVTLQHSASLTSADFFIEGDPAALSETELTGIQGFVGFGLTF